MEKDRGKGLEHVDLLRLDAVRAGEGTLEEREHVADCPHCSGILEDLNAAAVVLIQAIPRVPDVSPEVDRAVFARYRGAISTGERFLPWATRWPWFFPVTGALAGAAIVLVSALQFRKIVSPRSPSVAIAPRAQDLNGDGNLDILDAFQLARAIKAGNAAAAYDINGDGRVDARDTEALARHAVVLEGGDRG